MNEQDHDDRRRFVNVLRLSKEEHEALLAQLDHTAACSTLAPGTVDQRQARRVNYRGTRALILQVAHPGGTSVRYLVKPRNISETGLGVHHGGYVHPETPCIVALRTLNSEARVIQGRVVSCRHIRGRIHEVGIAFSQRLTLDEYVVEERAALNS